MQSLFTKKGDKGLTCNMAGKRLSKDSFFITILGKIDSLQSALDTVLLNTKGKEKKLIDKIQQKLWQTSGEISKCDKGCLIDPVQKEDIREIEKKINDLGAIPEKFVRFNTKQAILYNECRVRCRELETFLVKLLRKKQLRPVVFKYINRLSSLFFMLAYKKTK